MKRGLCKNIKRKDAYNSVRKHRKHNNFIYKQFYDRIYRFQAYWPVTNEKETFDGIKVKRTDVEEGEVITTTLTVQDKVRMITMKF